MWPDSIQLSFAAEAGLSVPRLWARLEVTETAPADTTLEALMERYVDGDEAAFDAALEKYEGEPGK